MNWDRAKTRLDLMNFPDDVGVERSSHANHSYGTNKEHQLKSYWLKAPPIEGFTCYGYYTYCPDCQKIWNKKLAIFNEQTNACHVKYFVKRGNSVTNEDSWVDQARSYQEANA